MDAAPRCPYCSETLQKMPSRKTKCKGCGGFMFVKSTPADRTKRLMTAAQAETAERAWERWSHEQAVAKSIRDFGVYPPPNRFVLMIMHISEHASRLPQYETVVEVRKRVWQQGAEIQRRARLGEEPADIAKSLGYSIITIREAIQNGGVHPRCTAECDKRAGQYKYDEFLFKRPLPCSDDCVCDAVARYAIPDHPDEFDAPTRRPAT